jgi:hypothetical protein
MRRRGDISPLSHAPLLRLDAIERKGSFQIGDITAESYETIVLDDYYEESKSVNGQQCCILVRMTQRSIDLGLVGFSVKMVHQE